MPTPSRLQHELRMSRPFSSQSQEVVLSLLRTADLLRRYLAGVVEPAGVTLQQYNVLRILRGAGEDGLPTLAVAERMVELAPGVTRLVDRLERKGWVERRRDAEDRRRIYCTITPKGLELLEGLDPQVQQADDHCLEPLGETGLTALSELLDQARAALVEAGTPTTQPPSLSPEPT